MVGFPRKKKKRGGVKRWGKRGTYSGGGCKKLTGEGGVVREGGGECNPNEVDKLVGRGGGGFFGGKGEKL